MLQYDMKNAFLRADIEEKVYTDSSSRFNIYFTEKKCAN